VRLTVACVLPPPLYRIPQTAPPPHVTRQAPAWATWRPGRARTQSRGTSSRALATARPCSRPHPLKCVSRLWREGSVGVGLVDETAFLGGSELALSTRRVQPAVQCSGRGSRSSSSSSSEQAVGLTTEQWQLAVSLLTICVATPVHAHATRNCWFTVYTLAHLSAHLTCTYACTHARMHATSLNIYLSLLTSTHPIGACLCVSLSLSLSLSLRFSSTPNWYALWLFGFSAGWVRAGVASAPWQPARLFGWMDV